MSGNRQYITKQFTVTVELHTDPSIEGFKWVRIYANCNDVAYMGSGKLLLACEAGSDKASVLLRRARPKAAIKLAGYKKDALAILNVNMNNAICPITQEAQRWINRAETIGCTVKITNGKVEVLSDIVDDESVKAKLALKIREALTR